jgi:hypothetical protein
MCTREYLVMGCGQFVLYDVTPSTSNTMLELEADRLSDQKRRIWPPLLQGPRSLTRVAAEGVAHVHVVGEERGEREARMQGAVSSTNCGPEHGHITYIWPHHPGPFDFDCASPPHHTLRVLL